MSAELTADQHQLARFSMGYDAPNDTIRFLPFVYDPEERVSVASVYAKPITSCETISILYLRSSGKVAGIEIQHVKEIMRLHSKQEGDRHLDCLALLGFAEAYVDAHLSKGSRSTRKVPELEEVHRFMGGKKIFIPGEILHLIAA